ncbi:Homoserine/homoserine lactone efflux protein [Rhodobacteraceae bacterium THAF1]|uniref:LysE family translocator n=1 Tax=Palleronia sp. THAF1 TaxID=2587842 RepID=UPI000F3EDA66|nr:LysE family translocator [Palleronia sp. THAF1]QFU09724.1 Homoserine/homoserine lactone efflux protein [Palleronia sp. THAF1]VDC17373.1 Homoserine/homoserine lactone efflux protein [Rhodobacteraceae bacterium THAF1]
MISLPFLLTALVVVLIPGTGVIYTVAIGLGRGRRASLWAALGCTFGIVPALVAATLGLAAVMHTSALAYHALRWAGVAYLLYLAWQALRSGGALRVDPDQGSEPGWRTALRGVLINALNPKLSIFFLALLPPFLSGDPTAASREMLVLGAVFMVLTFIVFAGYGVMAAVARDRVLSSPRALRWLSRGIAALFAGLAGKLAVERA